MNLDDEFIDVFPILRQFVEENRNEPAAAIFGHLAFKPVHMSRCEADLFVRITIQISCIRFVFDDSRSDDFNAVQVFSPLTDFDIDIIRSSAAEAIRNAVAIFDEAAACSAVINFFLYSSGICESLYILKSPPS